MSEVNFEAGQEVTLLGVGKKGIVDSVTEDGKFVVKYTDDGGAEQTETVAGDQIAPVSAEEGEKEEGVKADEVAAGDGEKEEEESAE
jgi:hypothetical protein